MDSGLKPNELYFEHLISVNIIKEKLKNSKKTKVAIRSILNENEVIVLTKEEGKQVDNQFKYSVPEDEQDRLRAVGIEIHPDSQDNHL